MNKAFFLDRDGIIIKMRYDKESGIIHSVLHPNQIQLVPGITKLLETTKSLGFKNIVISNQPDIGLRRIGKKRFAQIKEKIEKILKEKNVELDAQYYCLHHPFAQLPAYRKICNCRKPKPGLLLMAGKKHNIDLKRSWMLGDGVNDVISGYKAGCKTILLANLNEAEYLRMMEENLKGVKPDYLVKNLKEVITLL